MDVWINPDRWREILSSPLPGEAAHLKMAPAFRGAFRHQVAPVSAAVLILIYPSVSGIPSTVFMKRNQYDGPHSAQVSFPGGAKEKSDATLIDTAIRETREELGIVNKIRILGSLSDLHVAVSNYQVTPVLGYLDSTPEFHPDASEVQYIIETPLEILMDPLNRGVERIHRHGQYIETPLYRVAKEKIWGATAMILSEFLQLAARLQ